MQRAWDDAICGLRVQPLFENSSGRTELVCWQAVHPVLEPGYTPCHLQIWGFVCPTRISEYPSASRWAGAPYAYAAPEFYQMVKTAFYAGRALAASLAIIRSMTSGPDTPQRRSSGHPRASGASEGGWQKARWNHSHPLVGWSPNALGLHRSRHACSYAPI